MDLNFTKEDAAFRDEVRAFIAEAFDDDLRRKISLQMQNHIGKIHLAFGMKRLPGIDHQPGAILDRLSAELHSLFRVERLRRTLRADIDIVAGREIPAEHCYAVPFERGFSLFHHSDMPIVNRAECAGREQHG